MSPFLSLWVTVRKGVGESRGVMNLLYWSWDLLLMEAKEGTAATTIKYFSYAFIEMHRRDPQMTKRLW